MFDATASNSLGETRRSKVSIVSILNDREHTDKTITNNTKWCLSTNLSIPAFSRYTKSPLQPIHAVTRLLHHWEETQSGILRLDLPVGPTNDPGQRCMVASTTTMGRNSSQEMTLIHMTPKEMVHYRHSWDNLLGSWWLHLKVIKHWSFMLLPVPSNRPPQASSPWWELELTPSLPQPIQDGQSWKYGCFQK